MRAGGSAAGAVETTASVTAAMTMAARARGPAGGDMRGIIVSLPAFGRGTPLRQEREIAEVDAHVRRNRVVRAGDGVRGPRSEHELEWDRPAEPVDVVAVGDDGC